MKSQVILEANGHRIQQERDRNEDGRITVRLDTTEMATNAGRIQFRLTDAAQLTLPLPNVFTVHSVRVATYISGRRSDQSLRIFQRPLLVCARPISRPFRFSLSCALSPSQFCSQSHSISVRSRYIQRVMTTVSMFPTRRTYGRL